jgi:hypothetical protein
MASLGFEVNPPARGREGDAISAYQRQLSREVFVVLELDGPAYRTALERAANLARELEAKNERGMGKRLADEMIDRETRRSSRLFAVDAGLDREALRGRFGDRARYAIVHARILPTWLQRTNGKGATGFIADLGAATINVPLEMRGVFEDVAPAGDSAPQATGRRFEARLAFGRRLEPWLVSAVKQESR